MDRGYQEQKSDLLLQKDIGTRQGLSLYVAPQTKPNNEFLTLMYLSEQHCTQGVCSCFWLLNEWVLQGIFWGDALVWVKSHHALQKVCQLCNLLSIPL